MSVALIESKDQNYCQCCGEYTKQYVMVEKDNLKTKNIWLCNSCLVKIKKL